MSSPAQQTHLYLVEPAVELHETIRKRASCWSEGRYTIVPEALSSEAGESQFNLVSRTSGDVNDCAPRPYGCSSLLSLRDDIDVLRPEHKYTTHGSRMVTVTTAEQFMMANSLQRVDWMHCDAQGHDLNVLKGFGSLLGGLQGGVVEVASSDSGIMYQNQNDRSEHIRAFLLDNGFEIIEEESNSDKHRETNILFARKGAKIWETVAKGGWHPMPAT